MSQLVLSQIEAGVIEITINREDKQNALNNELFDQLSEVFIKIERNEQIRVAIISGKGENFAAGADLKMLLSATDGWKQAEQVMFGSHVIEKIANCAVPVIAAIKGYAVGGGLELALAADFRIAEDGARFGLPEIKLGLLPGAGGIQKLVKLIGTVAAKELMFTGKLVTAAEAYSLGIVNEVVDAGTALDAARTLARQLAQGPPVALRKLKLCTNLAGHLPDELGNNLARLHFKELLATKDAKEGISAFLEKRYPRFQGV